MAINKTLVIAAGVIFSILIWGCEDPNVKKGKEYYDAGDPAKAMVFFQDAIADDPENFEAHFNLAKAYKELDMLAQMVIEYQLAYTLDSTNLDLLEAYGHFSFDNRVGTDSEKRAYGMFITLLESDQAKKYSDAILEKITNRPYSYNTLVDGIKVTSYDEIYYKDWRLVCAQPTRNGSGVSGVRLLTHHFKDEETIFYSGLHDIGFAAYFAIDALNNKIIFIKGHDNNVEVRSGGFDGPNSELISQLLEPGTTFVPGRIKVGKEVIFTTCSFRRLAGKRLVSKMDFHALNLSNKKIRRLFTAIDSPLPKKEPMLILRRYSATNEAREFVDAMVFALSPDSKKLFFVKPGLRHQKYGQTIWRYDFNKGLASQILTQTFQEIIDLQVFPNSKYLLFVSKNGPTKLHILNLEEKALAATIKSGQTYSFLSNNNLIYCKRDSILTYAPLTKTKKSITQLNGAWINTFAFTEDGESVLYRYGDRLVTIAIPPKKMSITQLLGIVKEEYAR